MTNTGMTVSPAALERMGTGLRGDGHRLSGMAHLLYDDVEMPGSRMLGELLHGALRWREELRAEGQLLDDLGVAAARAARAIDDGDAAHGAAFGTEP
ncbi:hypothetical protein [Corynebacterium xerosis]|uniref:hypothetical protein n=1 Tax=Corynebacterium xerosis TaxID=1725 RepID=UPI000AF74182|nr:hypothetical protein [Corynebacterium xerosis]SQB95834.1 Uncharacterised protein [Clostridium paraputrificum]